MEKRECLAIFAFRVLSVELPSGAVFLYSFLFAMASLDFPLFQFRPRFPKIIIKFSVCK